MSNQTHIKRPKQDFNRAPTNWTANVNEMEAVETMEKGLKLRHRVTYFVVSIRGLVWPSELGT